MSLKNPPESVKPTRLEKLFSGYENSVFLPYFVWALNSFGLGAVDRLISKHATDFTIKQLRALIAELDKKYDKRIPEAGSDDFMAALNVATNALMESANDKKAKYFAAILAGAWESRESHWDEISQTLKLIRELEDVHILVLMEAEKLHNDNAPDRIALCLNADQLQCSRLDMLLTEVDTNLLQLALSELTNMGLLHNSFETSGRRYGQSIAAVPQQYAITSLGIWFLSKLHSDSSDFQVSRDNRGAPIL
ncbi:hypothetical protein [Metapseudomonas otitidis]|uniref:hypothetical protein n=1 Tax=Metapseudomonas otitidis TaxID=319939 RepID=UPI000D19DCF3|nr:hypothetical protein [Pseudomonas otitidis]